MKCIVLAAGYATRLYPLTENFPKPLLKVGEKSILDWLLDDIETTKKIDEYIVISNHKYFEIFRNWAVTKHYKVTVMDDGTLSNETRLGAVKDIEYAVKRMDIKDDVLVIAGDNLLDFSLSKFIDFCIEKESSCVMRYFEEDKLSLGKRGVLEIDKEGIVLNMEEKPINPKTQWCCPPFYFYTKRDVSRIGEALKDGCGYDAPGSYVAWLIKRTKVYSMEMPGKRFDVGNIKDYELIKDRYRGIR